MANPFRHFLGWDGTLLRRVAGWLLSEVGRDALPHCLVVVPTAQSARRLRETLAEMAGGAILSPRLRTAEDLFHPGADVAPQPAVVAAWAEALMMAGPETLSALVPEATARDRDVAWALALAGLLVPAIDRLAEAGLRARDVEARTDLLAGLGAGDGEAERWQVVGALEAAAGKLLCAGGFLSPAEAKIQRAENPVLAPGIERILFAALPDPVPLACAAANRLMADRGIRVDVLIDAPADLEAWFDEWGRPVADCWRDQPIDLPGGNDAISVVADDEAAARAAVAAACRAVASPGIGLCVPDATLVPAIQRVFLGAGWQVFDPEGRVAGRSGLLVFLDALCSLVSAESPTFDAASVLLRCPEAAGWPGVGCPHRVARALDDLHDAALPESLSDALYLLEKRAIVADGVRDADRIRQDALLLQPHLQALQALAAMARGIGLDHALREALDAVARHGCDDGAGGAHLAMVIDSLDGLRLAAAIAPGLGPAGLVDCWRRSLADVRAEIARPEAGVDALGWLETSYEPAPHLVVVGMHHGCVPDGVREDAFLPDGLRVALGLRSQETRKTRDAFLFRSFLEARRDAGSVHVVVSKFDGAGEPRRPSALLMLCREDQLASRVLHVFRRLGDDDTSRRVPRSRGNWMLSVPRDLAQEAKALQVLSPTLIKNYLTCPLRFYLREVLGMEDYDPERRELDPLGFGSLVHGVLEAFGRDEPMRDCTDEKQIAGFLDGALERRAAAQFGRSLGLPLMVQLEAARARLHAFARWQAADRRSGWRIHDIEFKVGSEDDRKWEVGGYPVRMKIDRIDRHQVGGRWRVLDYKTSAKAKPPEQAHLEPHREGLVVCGALVEPTPRQRSLRRWCDVQLPLYAAFWRHRLGGEIAEEAPIEVGYVNLPSALADTGFNGWDGFGPAIEALAIACAKDVAARLKAGVFWPPSPVADQKQWDPFARFAFRDLGEAFDAATRERLGESKQEAVR